MWIFYAVLVITYKECKYNTFSKDRYTFVKLKAVVSMSSFLETSFPFDWSQSKEFHKLALRGMTWTKTCDCNTNCLINVVNIFKSIISYNTFCNLIRYSFIYIILIICASNTTKITSKYWLSYNYGTCFRDAKKTLITKQNFHFNK